MLLSYHTGLHIYKSKHFCSPRFAQCKSDLILYVNTPLALGRHLFFQLAGQLRKAGSLCLQYSVCLMCFSPVFTTVILCILLLQPICLEKIEWCRMNPAVRSLIRAALLNRLGRENSFQIGSSDVLLYVSVKFDEKEVLETTKL